MKPLQLTVTVGVHRKLKEFSDRTGNSILAIIRIAIDEYIQRNTPSFVINKLKNSKD